MTRHRLAISSDLAAIAALAKAGTPYPWSEHQYRGSLEAGHAVWLAEDETGLLAVAVILNAAGEAELLDIVVSPACRRAGLATCLLQQVIQHLKQAGATRMLLEVRQSNAPAQALYARLGFRSCGVRKQYYPSANGLREDAILMEKQLG
ncbi:ribosomal protein S18-alanine N-acetyltransferase [Gulbenkiania mobilis]|uniref:[Ribosomal protein bS18]-alanine N-acetyltransferase n=1 Tax=Gulbenkiania mobilis TaxID=397457 RepID=A0ABY2CXL5_GULMO|nr:ribosomal-protein-alanine N-acetyltransferase [Gulbenkiania mobilis]